MQICKCKMAFGLSFWAVCIAAWGLLRESVQSTDACFQEETALFQYKGEDVSDSFEFRLP